ncbi:MAG: hypothetical protein QME94_01985, partial [Anaerolineae bacterium]|nr:hypothetical protein [Anaerolineae bacterium]
GASLATARAGFEALRAEQHGGCAPTPRGRQAPEEPRPRPPRPHEMDEARRFVQVAFGLLKLEGTIREDELYARVHALVQPGDWCSPALADALLRENSEAFKVLASGLVATHEVSNVQALAARKRSHRLPQRQWSAEELTAVATGKQPLSELEARIQAEMRQLTGIDVDVRVIQDGFRRGALLADFMWSLKHRHGVSDPEAVQRLEKLLEELYQHTRLWELSGWTPAEVAQLEREHEQAGG